MSSLDVADWRETLQQVGTVAHNTVVDYRQSLNTLAMFRLVRLKDAGKFTGRLAQVVAVMIDDRLGPQYCAMVVAKYGEGTAYGAARRRELLHSCYLLNSSGLTRSYWAYDQLEWLP